LTRSACFLSNRGSGEEPEKTNVSVVEGIVARPADDRPGPIVQLEGVRKSFGDNLVLDGIDLEVATGEVLVIIGPSGSGKSTLLRCVNLLEPIQSGQIRFEGELITVKGVDVSGVRQRIGIVFQQFNLFPHLTVMDNLTACGTTDQEAAAEGGGEPRP
jgi:polar amino acid transport system ATP-binding protein